MICLLLILVVGTVVLAVVAGPVAFALPVSIAAATGLVTALNQPRAEKLPVDTTKEDGNDLEPR